MITLRGEQAISTRPTANAEQNRQIESLSEDPVMASSCARSANLAWNRTLEPGRIRNQNDIDFAGAFAELRMLLQ